MKARELKEIRKALIQLQGKLASNLDKLQDDALKTAGEAVEELSDTPAEHMADRGSDNFVRDLKIGILQQTDAELCDISLALEKIENGKYGQCEACAAKIPMKRLRALPFARLCLACKQEAERLAARE